MKLEKSYSENGSTKCCTYTLATEPHVAVHLPNGCSANQVVHSQARQYDERFDAARFDALLTDYDRILLRFGMRISW